MDYNRRTVTLNDIAMGKRGRYYTTAEIIDFLTHYHVTPLPKHRRGRKLLLFQQLHELAHDRALSIADRRAMQIARMPQTRRTQRAIGSAPDAGEGSRGGEMVELHPQNVEPRASSIQGLRTCSVCLEEYGPISFPRSKITTACNHEPTICLDCLTQAIDSQIRDRIWDTLSCPLCPEMLSFEAVQTYSSQESFERYDHQATIHAMREIPNFRMCLGPGCGSGQVHGSGNEQPIMTCDACSFKTCFTHQMPWHDGLTCEAYDQTRQRQNRENEASIALLKDIGKICPNCVVPGIKVSGCDHLTCPRCGYEYCALCLASYIAIKKEGNTAHKPTCRYHSSRLGVNVAEM